MVDAGLIWNGNWAWAPPLIVFTLILHVVVLGLINARVVVALRRIRGRRNFMSRFIVVMGIVTLLATLRHALEAGIRAIAYRELGCTDETPVRPCCIRGARSPPTGTRSCIWRRTGG